MNNALIIVCDRKLLVYGQELYQSSAYVIEDVAKAAETDQIDLREALLVLGGELDGPHPLNRDVLQQALVRAGSCWQHYDESEEGSIEKAVKDATRRRQEVFCSFSLVA
jgi:predicted transcriptional regulator with HTH domain